MKWKVVKEYEGIYEVSDAGIIRRVNNKKILDGHIDQYGHKKVTLCNSGIRRVFSIHRLVAAAFIPNPQELSDVVAINGDFSDCRADNLRWSKRQGGYLKGENHPGVKLSARDVTEIRSLRKSGRTYQSIADEFNVSYRHAYDIVNGQRRKHD